MRRCAPLVVAESGTNTGGSQARRKGAHAGDKHVVSRPSELFSGPEHDNVTNPIGTELRGPCAFHSPHLLPGQERYGSSTGSRQRRRHVQRRMLLNDIDAVQDSSVPELGPRNVRGSSVL